ncbi:glycerol acyltransferase [Donghicola sp. C2-DW-16]|uniref:Glycerol acyltransferase n=1 Tax=Donghicola mangrovi TaxID=2729614 RepID=A0A850Q964_9RHOB|nr:lysophospholipid acyltransferase family protein [Donghicola mangrovi]NVO23508.1 glycerol acyltransferase [Donghicola mangrovi]NVO27034.1 glycerol acyltransferase [Donghicola mangrovi]
MKDRIDPLIAERAPWLFADRFGTSAARAILNGMLSYDRTLRIGTQVRDLPAKQIMRHMAGLLARDVEVSGLANLPTSGPALIVANHPTGIADGIILQDVIARVREDAYFYANSDILRILPQFGSMIAPVEWRHEKRSHAKTRETMAYTRKAVDEGRIGVIFPSGRLAKRRGLKLHERPWMASAAMIARKFDLPVIPVNIRARNSALFYLFDFIHPTLRDITLFHETLNKHRQPFRITVGEPISARALPVRSEEGIEMLREATLALGGRYAPTVDLWQNTRRPKWVKQLG